MQNFLVSRNRNSSRPGSFCWSNEWRKNTKEMLPARIELAAFRLWDWRSTNWAKGAYELPLAHVLQIHHFSDFIRILFLFFPHTHTTSHNFTLHTTPLCTSPKKLKTILYAFFASATFYQLYNCTIIIASTIHSTQIFHMRQYASSSIFRLIFFRWSTSSFEHRAQAKSIS